MTDTIRKVLAIPRHEFDKRNPFTGFVTMEGRPDLGSYLEGAAETCIARFIERTKAESDPSFLQIIPYICILCGTSVLTYTRGTPGEEVRLHGQMSIGVGGHIDDTDDDEPFFAYMKGLIREVREEVGMEITEGTLQRTTIGMVFDNSTSVGSVHLGICHAINVTEQQAAQILKNCENTMVAPAFVPFEELARIENINRLEAWSQHLFQHLYSEAKQDGKWTDLGFRERIGMLAITAANAASAATGFLMQDDPRGHMLSREFLEQSVGKFTVMMGVCDSMGDFTRSNVVEAANDFGAQLPGILKHQGNDPS